MEVRVKRPAKGRIGLDAFCYIMTAPRFAKVPKVLETPKGKEMKEDIANLAVLRELAVNCTA